MTKEVSEGNKENKPRFEESNLVVFMFGTPKELFGRSLHVFPFKGLEYPNFSVDLDNGNWHFSYGTIEHTVEIGNERGYIGYYPGDHRYGVIGVYDRTNDKHLNAMMHAAVRASERPQSEDDSYN